VGGGWPRPPPSSPPFTLRHFFSKDTEVPSFLSASKTLHFHLLSLYFYSCGFWKIFFPPLGGNLKTSGRLPVRDTPLIFPPSLNPFLFLGSILYRKNDSILVFLLVTIVFSPDRFIGSQDLPVSQQSSPPPSSFPTKFPKFPTPLPGLCPKH